MNVKKSEMVNKMFAYHMNNTPDPMRGIDYLSLMYRDGKAKLWFKEYLEDMLDICLLEGMLPPTVTYFDEKKGHVFAYRQWEDEND